MRHANLSLIVAVSDNGVIGREGDLPWKLSADLRHFKQLTMGHHIIMGRKTFDSIGRLLPGRTTVILTTNVDYRVEVRQLQTLGMKSWSKSQRTINPSLSAERIFTSSHCLGAARHLSRVFIRRSRVTLFLSWMSVNGVLYRRTPIGVMPRMSLTTRLSTTNGDNMCLGRYRDGSTKAHLLAGLYLRTWRESTGLTQSRQGFLAGQRAHLLALRACTGIESTLACAAGW
ncbi:MAG: dihydrofolate reductase [Pirellulaceae bacterium]